MIKRKHGTIVLISSMAGLLPLASAPSYSASKAAIKIFGEAMRSYLQSFQVQVCVVIPGYIDTPMTQLNKFPMPFKISAEQAAKIIIQGINNKKGLIVFPKVIYFLLKIISLFPYPLLDYINSKLPGKPSLNSTSLPHPGPSCEFERDEPHQTTAHLAVAEDSPLDSLSKLPARGKDRRSSSE